MTATGIPDRSAIVLSVICAALMGTLAVAICPYGVYLLVRRRTFSFSTVVPSFAHQRLASALGAGVIEPSE